MFFSFAKDSGQSICPTLYQTKAFSPVVCIFKGMGTRFCAVAVIAENPVAKSRAIENINFFIEEILKVWESLVLKI